MDMRLMSAAALLAGALALAGCGGGGNTVTPASGGNNGNGAGNGDGNGDGDGDGNTNSNDFMLLKLPAEADFDRTTADADEGTIPASGHEDIGNVRISCPEGNTPCTYEIVSGLIYANNGATAGLVPEPQDPEPPQISDDSGQDWLSDPSLIQAVKSNGSVEITRDGVDYVVAGITGSTSRGPGGTFNSNDLVTATSGSAVGTIVVDSGGGLETDLRLIHTRNRAFADVDSDRDRGLPGDYLVFGAWEERTAAIDMDGTSNDTDAPRTNPEAGTVWAGTIPRTDPEAWGIGSARYEGKALGHYKHKDVEAGDDWHEWDGHVELRANFAPRVRLINGTVTPREADDTDGAIPSTHGLGTINLKSSQIGASVNGKADIGGAGSGDWQAEFFGSATNGQPTGVAGGFMAKRQKGALEAAIVQGAFGGHNVDVLLDTVE